MSDVSDQANDGPDNDGSDRDGSDKDGPDRGRFTRMFDRAFISDALQRKEQEQRDEAELAETDRMKRESKRREIATSISERFRTKNEHLQRKFPGLDVVTIHDGLGERFTLPALPTGQTEGKLEFECEISHSGAAFHIHSRTSIHGNQTADRLSFPERRVDFARIDKFIERKILEFVRLYLGEEDAEG